MSVRSPGTIKMNGKPYPGHPCPEKGCVERKTAGQGCPGYGEFQRSSHEQGAHPV